MGLTSETRWAGMSGIAVVLTGWIGWQVWRRALPIRIDVVDLALVAGLIYALISIAWTSAPYTAVNVIVHMAAFVLVVMGFRSLAPQKLAAAAPWMALGLSLTIPALHYLRVSLASAGMRTGENENAVTHVLCAVLPFVVAGALGSKARRWLFIAAAALAVAFLLFVNTSKGEVVAVAAVTAIAGVRWMVRAPRRRVPVALVVAAVLSAGAAFTWKIPDVQHSLAARLQLVVPTALAWGDAPLFGHGAGSFDTEFTRRQASFLDHVSLSTIGSPSLIQMGSKHLQAGHAHNDPLQALAEYGIVGTLPWLALVVFAVVARVRMKPESDDYRVTAAAFQSLTIFVFLSLIDFPFQKPATLMVCALSLALLLPRGVPSSLVTPVLVPPQRSRTVVTAGMIVAALALVGSVQAFRAAHLYAVNEVYLNREPLRLHAAIKDVTALWPYDPQQRLMSFVSLVRHTELFPKARLDPAQADAAYRLSLADNETRPLLLLSRAQYLLNSGRWSNTADELTSILATLETVVGHQADVWILKAHWASLRHDVVGMDAALRRGRNAILVSPSQKTLLDRLQQHLEAQQQNPR